jgi:hypothetical protein
MSLSREILKSHIDDMENIWIHAGSKPFLSSVLNPAIHGKTLKKYKKHGYLSSSRPLYGQASKRTIWQITGIYLDDFRKKFGPEPVGMNREEPL